MRLSEVTKPTVKQVALEFQSALLDEFDENVELTKVGASDLKLEMNIDIAGQQSTLTMRMFEDPQASIHVGAALTPGLRGNRIPAKTDYQLSDSSISVILPGQLSTGRSSLKVEGGWGAVAQMFAHEVAAQLHK